jgi:hypothetical protein
VALDFSAWGRLFSGASDAPSLVAVLPGLGRVAVCPWLHPGWLVLFALCFSGQKPRQGGSFELELGLIQARMTQKPFLWVH